MLLKGWIAAQPHRGHGSKATLARAAQCQTAYISQVVLGDANLSLEQAERLGPLFQFTEEETEYFLLLVQRDRAGTETLKHRFTKQLLRIREHRSQLKSRLNLKTRLDAEAQAMYFSSWVYSAIHVLVTIPKYQTREAISKRLNLPVSVIEEGVEFLQSVQLIELRNGKLTTGTKRIHLPHDSPLISKHHINWRLRTINDLEIKNDQSLHYSSCVSISKKDASLIRSQFLKLIESTKETIQVSQEEELYSFCLDFFEV